MIYLAGRIFREEITRPKANRDQSQDEGSPELREDEYKWVYERWNKAITTDQYANIEETLASLHIKAREEIGSFEGRVVEAKAAVAAAAEKRR